MKLVKSMLCLLCIFAFTSCNNLDYQNKDIESMNIIELNNYLNDRREINESLKKEYERLIEISDGLTKEKVIELINYINKEVVKSNVMITSESKSFFHATSVSSGSGTIIKEDDYYYYVLTNNHVIYSLGNRSSYYIYDYLNKEYRATLMFASSDYDMALLRFSKGNNILGVSSLANKDIEVDKNIITIGQPLGQRNAITFGEVLKYEKVDCQECNPLQSNVKYDCVYYNAITTNGNSGGMLINYEFELVGIVTFGMNASNGKYLYGAGSPVSRIREFLLKNNFMVGDNDE